MKTLGYLFLVLAFSCSMFEPAGERPLPSSLGDAVSARNRFPEHKKRDYYQHPEETLEFFGVQPDMTVVEISPGSGYYAEILAPYLALNGQYVMTVPRMEGKRSRTLMNNEKKMQDILLRYEMVKTKTRFIPLELPDERNKTKTEYADFVLMFTNIHQFVAKNEIEMVFQLTHAVLKPQGKLGVIQHRIAAGKKNFPQSGYMTEAEVIKLAQTYGFKFLKKSEINANPKDKADYPKGVWTLPPTYRLGQKDKDKYEDIGESDRMTLLFEKE